MEKKHTGFPSFFKVLISDYAKKLQIPPAFEAKFDVNMPKNATIKAKRGTSKWAVKIKQIGESLCFSGDSWEKLVVDNNLKYGDFLIFRLISYSVFDIATYGPNGCEKVVLDTKLRNAETRGCDLDMSDEDEENLMVALSASPSLNHKCSPTGASISCRRVSRPRIIAEKGGAERKKNLCFVLVLKKYNKYYVTIPKAFAYGAGLEEKKFVVLKNRQGKLWPVDVRKRKQEGRYGRIDISGGWRNFWDDNKLMESDSCLFKFVTGSGNVIQVEISPTK